ncbi:hypothetical protein ACFQ80_20420 [Isoptericola sp. NPDC056578]|uniref:hypothetical protein n=1 Tax=Isoptericola sp. NPDC056578 TaxID=3345870 RepID=UPI0036BC8741
MTAEWYDLGQRLHAAHTRRPADRLAHAPITAAPCPVAVRAHRDGDSVTIAAAAPGVPASTATGRDAFELLASLGVTLAADTPATLVTDDPRTLPLLHTIALTAPADSEHDAVAAHIAWWRDRADFPGGRAVVDTLDACRTRWTLGEAPTAERQPSTWRRWLTIPDDSTTGLLDLHTRLSDGEPLQWLDVLSEDDEWSYGAAQSALSDGFDWRRRDTTTRAALGLRSRCDAADLYAAALLSDPLYRDRARHTGHVVTGTAHQPQPDKSRRIDVTCTRMDARLRPGNTVTGWTGTPTTTNALPFTAQVHTATVRAGRLVLSLTGTTGLGAPPNGARVTLMPSPPSPSLQRRGRSTYRALYSARRSWLTTGRTPTPTRRPVPLDVLVAGAEPS